MHTPLNIVFFGGEPLGVTALEVLASHGIIPELIVCNPDRPQGRKMLLTPPPVKVWAESHSIKVFQPETLKDDATYEALKASNADVFLVVAYGKIIPERILNIPIHKTLNMHPSLLPKLRGPSPIRSAILHDIHPTGVSIMVLTPGMDEGPILAQESVTIPAQDWPISGTALDAILAKKGSELLAKTIRAWVDGSITPQDQKHDEASYTTKITKEMGLIDLKDDPHINIRKIRALDGWPGTYFFHDNNGSPMRIKITKAELEGEKLKILRVVPEGKKEMNYEAYIKSASTT